MTRDDEQKRIDAAKALTIAQMKAKRGAGGLSPIERMTADAAASEVGHVVRAAMTNVGRVGEHMGAALVAKLAQHEAHHGRRFQQGRKPGTVGLLRLLIRAEIARARVPVKPRELWDRLRHKDNTARLRKAGVTFAGDGVWGTPDRDITMHLTGDDGATRRVSFKTFSNVVSSEAKALRGRSAP